MILPKHNFHLIPLKELSFAIRDFYIRQSLNEFEFLIQIFIPFYAPNQIKLFTTSRNEGQKLYDKLLESFD